MLNTPEHVQTQYQTSANLDARIQLHERFSTNKYDWMLWVFDQFALPTTAQLLEVGCGTGLLWQTNLARLPAGWTITLSDQSAGMLQQALQNLGDQAIRFRFEQFNTEAIPLPDASLDAVIANHMLYHVADLAKALGEIRRVLKPGGRLYAATNGENHMKELRELVRSFVPGAYEWVRHAHFSLEDGAQWLATYFDQVELRGFASDLLVTEVEPLVAYVLSMHEIPAARQAEFTHFVEQQLEANQGALRIQKAGGLFCALK
jgi:ubiquinone/menaquinone biosynthesis C-methylase UbiE